MNLLGLLLACLCWHAAPRAGADEAARERLRLATQAKEAALRSLEEAYLRVEQSFLAWREAESSRTAAGEPSLASALATLYGEKAAAWEAKRAGVPLEPREARAARKAEIEELAAAYRELLTARGLVEATLRDPLADKAARELAGKPPLDAAVRLQPVLQPWLGAAQRFEQLWNDALCDHAPESLEWRARYDEAIAAGVELDRSEHPESYLPGGAKTRPGMVYVAGGNYVVGPNVGIERKKKRITVRPFMIDRCEVTQAEYQAFLEALPVEQRAARTPRNWPVGADGKAAPPPELRDHPVTFVTWRDADAFARHSGKRLPTEDEWEVACRGKEALLYPWGAEWREGVCNDAKANLGATVPANGLLEGASPFKVLQMAGNVEEWTASSEEGDTLVDLPSNMVAVVVRGGHFRSPPEYASGAFRWVAPGGSTREPHLGFRCAADLK
ncbi:MAG: SUMF1/EgtB/PvdO family nonheme iron enzyme [Planctomycetes bacterium]|nr:SUMF1/EgtB/PvdO family nonheme iron enzyme [Planctomycetota bacterium]